MGKRIAIITGASSGIGKSTALMLAKQGVKVILNARDKQKLEEVESTINNATNELSSKAVSGNIVDKDTIANCIEASLAIWGELPSIFIASAGRGLPGTLITSNSDKWQEVIDINIMGLMNSLKHISKLMLEMAGNRNFIKDPMDIVVIGSSIGRNVSPFNSIYGATKFAAHGLTEALRRELGPYGIRVTLIEPGLVSTNFQASAGYDENWFKRYSEEVGPVLLADDIAKVINFLIMLPGNVNLDNISIRPTRQSYP